MNRKILAGVLGGLVAFVWSSIAHTVLPLGQAGVSTLPNEQAVLATLKREVPRAGLYLFPAPSDDPAQAQADPMASYRDNPSGVLVYNPPGRTVSFPNLLGVELVGTLFAGLIAGALMMRAPLSIGQGALIGANLGIFTWLCVSLSYWNWYDFPSAYVWAEGADQVVGWLLGGVVIAMVGGRTRS
jgi:heme exporter protein D